MKPHPILLTFTMFLGALLAGCGGESNDTTHPDAQSAGETEDEPMDFASWARQFVSHPTDEPLRAEHSKWFEAHFPADLAGRLTGDLAQMKESGASLAELIEAQKRNGRTEVEVVVVDGTDPQVGTGGQHDAIQAMTTPATLYGVRLKEPGKSSGFHIWSFAELDGEYILVGKMRPACRD